LPSLEVQLRCGRPNGTCVLCWCLPQSLACPRTAVILASQIFSNILPSLPRCNSKWQKTLGCTVVYVADRNFRLDRPNTIAFPTVNRYTVHTFKIPAKTGRCDAGGGRLASSKLLRHKGLSQW
jgi:hypothetical protein